MIVPNQTNLKVHFAGAEEASAVIACCAADVQYQLLSAFKLIGPQFDLDVVRMFQGKEDHDMPGIADQVTRHAIMDSGIFSLMFGSYQNIYDFKFLDRWQNALVEFIHKSGYKGTVIECDIQKILSPEAAWKLRRKLRKKLPDHRILNVFHIEDGQKGLDRLIEYSDYLSIGLPELRKAGKKEYAIRLANYIKEKKPEIDIHLLGCTETSLLRRLSFCSSADSMSWRAALKFGVVKTTQGVFHVDKLQGHSYLEPFYKRAQEIRERFGFNHVSIDYTAKSAFAAEQTKLRYANAAGNQE